MGTPREATKGLEGIGIVLGLTDSLSFEPNERIGGDKDFILLEGGKQWSSLLLGNTQGERRTSKSIAKSLRNCWRRAEAEARMYFIKSFEFLILN